MAKHFKDISKYSHDAIGLALASISPEEKVNIENTNKTLFNILSKVSTKASTSGKKTVSNLKSASELFETYIKPKILSNLNMYEVHEEDGVDVRLKYDFINQAYGGMSLSGLKRAHQSLDKY